MKVHWLAVLLTFYSSKVNIFFTILGGLFVLYFALINYDPELLLVLIPVWIIGKVVDYFGKNEAKTELIQATVRIAFVFIALCIAMIFFKENVCSVVNSADFIPKKSPLRYFCFAPVETSSSKTKVVLEPKNNTVYTKNDVDNIATQIAAFTKDNKKNVEFFDKCIMEMFTMEIIPSFWNLFWKEKFKISWNYDFPDVVEDLPLNVKDKLTFNRYTKKEILSARKGAVDFGVISTSQIITDENNFVNCPKCFENFEMNQAVLQTVRDFGVYFLKKHQRICFKTKKKREDVFKIMELGDLEQVFDQNKKQILISTNEGLTKNHVVFTSVGGSRNFRGKEGEEENFFAIFDLIKVA